MTEVITGDNLFFHQYTRSYGHPRLVNALAKLYGKLLNRQIDAMNEILITVAPTPRHGIDLSFRITVDEDGPAEVAILAGSKSTLAPFEEHGPDLLATILGEAAGKFAGLLQPVLSSGIYQLTDVIGAHTDTQLEFERASTGVRP